MKFTKTVTLEIEITEELINHLINEYADEEEDDFHDPRQLESLLDELIGIYPYSALEEIGWNGVRRLTTITEKAKVE
jgi:hypothetical protein